MVNGRNLIISTLVAIAGVIIIFFWLFTGEEAKIKKQFKNLADLISTDSDEHQLIAAANARKIGNMFAETCLFEIPTHSISRTFKRENIPAQVMAARSQYSSISLKFHDIHISFPDDNIAWVAFTAYVELVSLSDEPLLEVNEFVCRMEKVEKDWFLNRIEAISVLER
jgi:hypothetical protein